MGDLTWGGWGIVAIVVAVMFLRTALDTFRRKVRRQFVELLHGEYPDLEVIRLRTRSVKFRTEAIGEAEFFFSRLYTAIAELGVDDDEARAPVYREFLTTLTDPEPGTP